MATPSGFTGGHSFVVKNNFNGCNATGCHASMSATNAAFTGVIEDIDSKLAELGSKLDLIATPSILQKDPVTGEFTGYFDIYDPGSNASGKYKSPSTTGYTTDQRNYNNTLPALPPITNAQFGAILNFALVLRDGSHGIHNYPYIKKLLENTIAAI